MHNPSIPRMRTATRDVQHFSTVTICLANEISVGLSAKNRRLCLVEAHLSRTRHIDKRNNGSTASNRSNKNESKSTLQSNGDRSAYWHQMASTLSKENARLTSQITDLEEKCTRQQESIRRLSRNNAAVNEELASTRREILRLTACENAILLPSTAPVRLQSIPIDPQGKDGMYWYQTCRTMEAQFIQRTAELQATIDKLIETAAHRGRH